MTMDSDWKTAESRASPKRWRLFKMNGNTEKCCRDYLVGLLFFSRTCLVDKRKNKFGPIISPITKGPLKSELDDNGDETIQNA